MRRDGQALNFATPASALKKLLAADPTPIPLGQFAEMTAVKNEPQAAAPQAQVSAPRSAPTRPPFPEKVAGFAFGMTLEQAKFACSTPENQELARKGYPWYTQLIVDGVSAMCRFAPEPLDFVKTVHLVFASDQLVRIGLAPTTYERAHERLFAKYGNPLGCLVGGKAVLWNAEAERRAKECGWFFNGGYLSLAGGKSSLVLYISGAEDELKKQGY